jgi:hypothetical protein
LRRVIGSITLGLGFALIAIGLLARPVMYDNLATVPLDQKSTSVSMGQNMSALHLYKGEDGSAKYDKLTGVTLKSTREVRGIPGVVTPQHRETEAFWQTGVTSEAIGVGKLTFSQEGVSFNRTTGQSTNCCGDFKSAGDLDNPEKTVAAVHEGLFFKFPFDVEKTTYKWWDGDLGEAVDMKYVRSDTLFGTDTYVFEQVTPRTEVATREVPAAIFGGEGDVPAKVMYANTRTLWVEPNTGVIIKGQEALDKSLVSDLGEVATTKGTIGYDEKTVRDNAEAWGSKGRLLGFVGGPLMPVAIALGLILVGLGLFLVGKANTPRPQPERAVRVDQLMETRRSRN